MSNFAEDFSHQATKIIDMEYLTSDNQEAVFFSVLFFSSLIFCGNSQPPRNLTRLLVNILGILVNTSGHILGRPKGSFALSRPLSSAY
jgi:hypothetical protein